MGAPLLRLDVLYSLACTLALSHWVRWAASVCLRPCLHRPPATPWFPSLVAVSQSHFRTTARVRLSLPLIALSVVFNASPACVLPQHRRPLIAASTEDCPHCSAAPPIFIYLFNILNTQQEKDCFLPTPYLRSKQGFPSEAAFWGRSCRRQDRAPPPSQKKSRGRTRNSNGCCSLPPPLLGRSEPMLPQPSPNQKSIDDASPTSTSTSTSASSPRPNQIVGRPPNAVLPHLHAAVAATAASPTVPFVN